MDKTPDAPCSNHSAVAGLCRVFRGHHHRRGGIRPMEACTSLADGLRRVGSRRFPGTAQGGPLCPGIGFKHHVCRYCVTPHRRSAVSGSFRLPLNAPIGHLCNYSERRGYSRGRLWTSAAVGDSQDEGGGMVSPSERNGVDAGGASLFASPRPWRGHSLRGCATFKSR